MGFDTPGAASSAADLAPSWKPQRLQNRGPNPKKSMLKNNIFLASIFKGFGPRFGRVFGRFLGSKMHEKRKNAKLAKTLKIMIFPRENLYFQGFDVFKFQLKLSKSSQNLDVLEDIDLGRIWGGFGEGFGRPKSSIFACFFHNAVDGKC